MNSFNMFSNNNGSLTDSLNNIVNQLNAPLDSRPLMSVNDVSSYLNFTQTNNNQQAVPGHVNKGSNHQQYKLQCSQTQPITRFEPRVNDAPDEHTRSEYSLSRAIGRSEGLTNTKVSLGKATVRGQQFIVGTDDASAAKNYIVLVDGNLMLTKASVSPVACIVTVPEHVRDIRWVAPRLVVAAIGKGKTQLYNIDIDRSNASITSIGQLINSPHTDYVRELAPHPLMGNIVASVGQDGMLYICDYNRLSDSQGLVQQHMSLSSSVSSVRWPMYNQSVCVSITTDSGNYAMFDTRQANSKPVVAVETHNLVLPAHYTSHSSSEGSARLANPSTSSAQLYTHERYTDHHVLLGYSNGIIKHIDMRNSKQYIDVIQDPYVEGIGNIEYNCRSRSLLVSGYTDFTVWKHENSGATRVWSHALSETNTRDNVSGYSCNATYFDDDTVLVTDSLGSVGLRVQGFV